VWYFVSLFEAFAWYFARLFEVSSGILFACSKFLVGIVRRFLRGILFGLEWYFVPLFEA